MEHVQPICPFTNTFVCKWQKSLLKHAFEATVPSKSLSSTPSKPLCCRTLCASMPSKPAPSTSLLKPGFEDHTPNMSSQPLRARSHSFAAALCLEQLSLPKRGPFRSHSFNHFFISSEKEGGELNNYNKIGIIAKVSRAMFRTLFPGSEPGGDAYLIKSVGR